MNLPRWFAGLVSTLLACVALLFQLIWYVVPLLLFFLPGALLQLLISLFGLSPGSKWYAFASVMCLIIIGPLFSGIVLMRIPTIRRVADRWGDVPGFLWQWQTRQRARLLQCAPEADNTAAISEVMMLGMASFCFGVVYFCVLELKQSGYRYGTAEWIGEWILVSLLMLFFAWAGLAALAAVLTSLGLPVPRWLRPAAKTTNKTRALTQEETQALNDLHTLFDAALHVVSAYGNTLTDIAGDASYASVTQLPLPKEGIRDAIMLVYALLDHDKVRGHIKAWYPEHAEHIVSESFTQSLLAGLRSLPLFLPENDFATMQEFAALGHAAQAAVAGQGSLDTMALAQKIAHTPFLDEVIRIQQSVWQEQDQYITALEQQRTVLAVEVQRLQQR